MEYLASEGGIALLDVNPGLAIWTTIVFAVVYMILRYLAWGPIASALDSRAEKIHADIDRAESVKKEAEALLTDYRSKLEALRDEGDKILADARKDAEKLKEEILAAAKKEADDLREQGSKDISMAVDQALERLHHEVVQLSVTIAGQVIGKSLNADDHKKLIDESLDKLKSLN